MGINKNKNDHYIYIFRKSIKGTNKNRSTCFYSDPNPICIFGSDRIGSATTNQTDIYKLGVYNESHVTPNHNRNTYPKML